MHNDHLNTTSLFAALFKRRKRNANIPDNRFRSEILSTVVLTIVLLLIVVVIFEIFYTPYETSYVPFYNVLYPYVEFRPPSNYTWQSEEPSASSRSRRRAVAYTNADGLRIPSPSRSPETQKPPATIRIAVLGGSTVHGGTDFEVSLPGALQRELVNIFPGKNIEVLSAGIISAISIQQLIFLITTIVDYDVDIVINYDGINDSGQMLYYEQRFNYPYNYSVKETAWNLFVNSRREPLWRVVLDRSKLLSRLFPDHFGHAYHTNTIAASRLINEPDLRRQYSAAYIANWERIRRVCIGYDITPFFILQPISIYSVDGQGKYNGILNENHEANFLVYEAFREEVANFASRNPDLGVADYSDLLPSTDYFYDGCHVFDEVNIFIAQNIADLISPTIRLKLKVIESRETDRKQ
jgi:hypothetical protein